MDKKFLQSIGLEIGLPRWKAYALYIGGAAVASVGVYAVVVVALGLFGN